MTDPRPSEHQDDRLELAEMRRRGFFDDVPTLGRDFFVEPVVEEMDPIEDLIEQAENAHLPEQALVYAQIATVRAIQALTATLLQEVTR